MAARDLTERESGFFNTDTTPDPYVQVILDDTELPGENSAAGFLAMGYGKNLVSNMRE